MHTISLCMIVKNEEKTIARCLNSVKNVVDEIIIVDTGSTDKTKEICAAFTDKIFDYSWNNNFSDARNYSYQKASMEYLLWLDADDIVLPKDNIKMQTLKENLDSDIKAVMMKYNTAFDQKGNVVFSYYRERLSKRECQFLWMEPVHEYLKINGRTINSDICITHGKLSQSKQNPRNLVIYEDNLKKGIKLSARGTYYYARELKDNKKYDQAIDQFEKFLDSDLGWQEDNINACGELAKCYLQMNCPQKALQAMFRSFIYDVPRAEICCQLGYFYKEQLNYKRAIYWFKLILSLEKPYETWGFIQPDCWDYIPLIECAVCYDQIKEYKLASDFNELALQIKPDSEAALRNREYFKTKI